jgi:antitoxin component of RelBE/YafQ-DinJ toxin-antitoxin module
MKTNSLFEKPKKSAMNITVDNEIKETMKTLSKENKISTSKIINLILTKLKEDEILTDIEKLENFLKS